MKKSKKTELQLEKVVVIALNNHVLLDVRSGQDAKPRSDMWERNATNAARSMTGASLRWPTWWSRSMFASKPGRLRVSRAVDFYIRKANFSLC